MSRLVACLGGLMLLALGVSACGVASSSSASAPVTVTQTATATASVTVTDSPTPEPSPTPADDGTFVMPNEVGKGLQTAQDDVQAASGNPAFYTDSTDALGADRYQIFDRDWKVCSQNKPPGARIAADDTSISFAVVKLDERCP